MILLAGSGCRPAGSSALLPAPAQPGQPFAPPALLASLDYQGRQAHLLLRADGRAQVIALLQPGAARPDRFSLALGQGPPVSREHPTQAACEVALTLLPGAEGLTAVPTQDQGPLSYAGASWRVTLFAEGPAGRREKTVAFRCLAPGKWSLDRE